MNVRSQGEAIEKDPNPQSERNIKEFSKEHGRRKKLKVSFNKLLKRRKRSRVKWLKERDWNTKFFHGIAS